MGSPHVIQIASFELDSLGKGKMTLWYMMKRVYWAKKMVGTKRLGTA